MGLKYNIYLDGEFIKESTSLSTLVDGLEAETEYSVAVSETDGETESKKTPSVKFKTLPNPNLLPNSTWNLGEGTWTFNVGNGNSFEILEPEPDKPDKHILHAEPLAAGSQQISNIPHPMWVEAGQVVTLSFDFKENQIANRDSTLFALRLFPESDTTNSQANSIWFENIVHSTVNPDWTTTPILDFTRFSYTTTVPVEGWLDLVIYDSDSSGTHESWWRELKLEEGDKATSWIPAESDHS